MTLPSISTNKMSLK
ncbi:hypothetical protein VCHENC02_4220A, partial [Vibrio harveyi]